MISKSEQTPSLSEPQFPNPLEVCLCGVKNSISKNDFLYKVKSGDQRREQRRERKLAMSEVALYRKSDLLRAGSLPDLLGVTAHV